MGLQAQERVEPVHWVLQRGAAKTCICRITAKLILSICTFCPRRDESDDLVGRGATRCKAFCGMLIPWNSKLAIMELWISFHLSDKLQSTRDIELMGL